MTVWDQIAAGFLRCTSENEQRRRYRPFRVKFVFHQLELSTVMIS